MWLNGAALADTDADGNTLTDDTFLILFNASWNPQSFTLPSSSFGTTWTPVLDTTQATGAPPSSATALPDWLELQPEPTQPPGPAWNRLTGRHPF